MRIIILSGGNNVGKSTLLNTVFDELTSFFPVKSTPKRVLGNPDQKDFECIVTLKDERKVAFFTLGDHESDIIDAIAKYSFLDCEILILAINHKYNNIIESLKFPYNIVEKTEPFREDSSRLRDAGTILSLI